MSATLTRRKVLMSPHPMARRLVRTSKFLSYLLMFLILIPRRSLAFAYIQNADSPEPRKYLSRVAEPTGDAAAAEPSKEPTWGPPAKAAIKKAESALSAYKKKMEKQRAAEKQERERRENALEEAKKVVLTEDPSLPPAKRITIGDKTVEIKRVEVRGRIHRIRQQKAATFLTLTDGNGYLQCILEAGPLTKCLDAMLFTQGTSLAMFGEMKAVKEGQQAPDGRELLVDYFRVYGHAPSDADALTNRVSASQSPWDAALLDNRHLVLRGEHASAVMRIRAATELAFIQTLTDMKFTKVSPPALGKSTALYGDTVMNSELIFNRLVQTQVEGGATLFTVPYYGETAFLTQSSQLYLETVLPSLGNVYCM